MMPDSDDATEEECDVKEVTAGSIRFHFIEAVERGKRFCWGLCCMQGCIWGIIGAIYFFFLLPSGFLLILYGTNKSIPWAIVTGSIILGLSTCGMPSLCLCVRWYRRKKRDRRTEYRIQRNKELAKVTFDNPAESPEVPV